MDSLGIPWFYTLPDRPEIMNPKSDNAAQAGPKARPSDEPDGVVPAQFPLLPLAARIRRRHRKSPLCLSHIRRSWQKTNSVWPRRSKKTRRNSWVSQSGFPQPCHIARTTNDTVSVKARGSCHSTAELGADRHSRIHLNRLCLCALSFVGRVLCIHICSASPQS